MRRIIVVLAVWAWIPLSAQPLWGQAPSVGEPAGKASTASNDKAAEALFNWGTLVFTGIAAAATASLVIVGWCGVRAANRTLRAIEKQADLMAIPFRSWIALDNWRTEYISGPNPPATNRLRIQVDILNPTDFPLTIAHGGIKFKTAGGPGYARYEIKDGSFLPPKSRHAIDVSVFISEEHADTFARGMFLLPVEGQFSHFGQLGEESIFTQRFAGWLECGEGAENKFQYQIHMNPENKDDYESGQNTS